MTEHAQPYPSIQAEGGTPPFGVETQASVTEWTDLHYPGEKGNLAKKVRNVVEEIGELCSELGYDPEEMAEHFLRSARRPPSGRPPGDLKGAAGEVGDGLLALYEVAECMRVRAHGCLDAKMVVNRAKSPEESAARVARKAKLGL